MSHIYIDTLHTPHLTARFVMNMLQLANFLLQLTQDILILSHKIIMHFYITL